jgi:gas vesicle protein
MAERDEFGAFLIGFIVGGLTGAAISLIMAPQSGEETREYIKDRAIELRDKAQETAVVAKDQVTTTAATVRNQAGDLANKARTGADDLRQRGQVMVEERSKPQNKAGGEEAI